MLYNAYSQKLPGKSRKDNVSYLNIMVLGSAGSGKTAFVRTFCETLKNDIIPGSYRESIGKVLQHPLKSTRELYTVSMHVEEDNGQRTALTLIDTPGFTPGPTVDQQIRYIAKYIDYQFERTLAEVRMHKRKKIYHHPGAKLRQKTIYRNLKSRETQRLLTHIFTLAYTLSISPALMD